MRRPEGRMTDQLRPLKITPNVNLYAEGSALIECGATRVLCTASVEEKVPSWMEGKSRGWVTAEYSMLPRSTHTRSKRDREKVSGRTQEIQRLIARALRTCVSLEDLGPVQITVDCDVLQADGGTRTASITGGCVALALAVKKLIASGKSKPGAWLDTVAAVSLGLKDGAIFTDLDYLEDSSCDVDMNFVMTGSGLFVEVQGTAEKKPFSGTQLLQITQQAEKALQELTAIQQELLK